MELYSKNLLNTIGKVYQLPQYRSREYNLLVSNINIIANQLYSKVIDRQIAANSIAQIINNLQQQPRKEGRAEERIANIIEPVAKRNIIPRSILDIGAGTGDITIALKNYYNLPTSQVFAIDQKLPNLTEVTTLTYINGKIPLPDKSIDLIVMFMVLHHIPPEYRLNILSEMKRVLSPNGIIVIREHDDNKDPRFYTFLDLIHLIWYIAYNETPDPLYLSSQDETRKLFSSVGLNSIGIDKYPDPNPQQIYHEYFIHSPNNNPYKFKDVIAQATLQQYVDILKSTPPSYQAFMSLPLSIRNKYMNTMDYKSIWPDIIKQFGLLLLITALKYTPSVDGIRYLTKEAIDSAYNEIMS